MTDSKPTPSIPQQKLPPAPPPNTGSVMQKIIGTFDNSIKTPPPSNSGNTGKNGK